MGIFGKQKPSLSSKEKFVAGFDREVAAMSEKQVTELADWIFRYIPVIVSQATSAPQTGALARIHGYFSKNYKKLICDVFSPLEALEALIAAIPQHAPTLHKIILQQTQRWREQQQQLRNLQTQPAGPVLEAEIVEPGPKLLEPPK